MHSTENRFAIGPSNRLFIVVYVSIFQPGNFTGLGGERVNQNVQHNGPDLYFLTILMSGLGVFARPDVRVQSKR